MKKLIYKNKVRYIFIVKDKVPSQNSIKQANTTQNSQIQ
jgi:hypothetical protein